MLRGLTMIAQLLDKAPVEEQEEAAKDPVIKSIMGEMNPQHAIVNGLGASPNDSVGYPWSARYTIASGNLLADFRANLTPETQGRLQVCRLYEMTDDPGVRDILSFLIARDTMHQNQWAAAFEELQQKEGFVVPSTFNKEYELHDVSQQFLNCSRGTESKLGRWASGPSIDGKGEFTYVENPQPAGQSPELKPAPGYIHGTPLNPNL